MMVKFNIIESHDSGEEYNKYEKFKDYYINTSIPIWKISEELNINMRKAGRWIKDIVNETGFSRSKKIKKKDITFSSKYYYPRSNGFIVQKWVNGKMTYFGKYSTEKEAKEVVEYLKKNNWNM